MKVAADSLNRDGVIGSPRLFRLYAKLRGSDRGIKAGTYEFRRNASWGSVLEALRSGKGVVTATIAFRDQLITARRHATASG